LTEQKPVAMVTGAAQGIGRRTAEILAARGYRVALNDLRALYETIQSVESLGSEALIQIGNIADESVVEEFVRRVYDKWGRADVLVNNAGISFISPAESTSAADYRRVLDVNLVAPFLLAKAFGTRCSRSGVAASSMWPPLPGFSASPIELRTIPQNMD